MKIKTLFMLFIAPTAVFAQIQIVQPQVQASGGVSVTDVNKIDTLKWTRKSISDRTAVAGLPPLLKVLTLGDSLGQDGWPRGAMSAFGPLYRCFLPSNNTVSGGAAVTTADFTRWPSGQYITISASGTAIFPSVATSYTSGTAKLYYVKEVGSGTLAISTRGINLDGTWPASWTTHTAALDTSGTATTAGVVNIALSGGFGQYQVAASWVSGTSCVLGVIPILNTGGVVEMSATCSGSIISQQSQTAQAILSAVLGDYQPTLGFWWAYETVEDLANDLPGLFAKVDSANPKMDWVFSGLHPNTSQSDNDSQTCNAMVKAFAEGRHNTYVDLFTPFSDASTMVSLGWLQDTLHLNATGYSEMARVQWAALPGLREWADSAGAQKFYLPIDIVGTRQTNWSIVSSPSDDLKFSFRQDSGASYGWRYPRISSGYAAGRLFAEHNSTESVLSYSGEGIWVAPFATYPHTSGFARGAAGGIESMALTTGGVPIVAGGINGQTADLQQWRVAMSLSSTGTATTRVDSAGNLTFNIAGRGLKIKEGINARMGTATLSSGSVTIANTTVTGSTRFAVTPTEVGTLNGRLRVSERASGTSFTVSSSDSGDTCTFDWLLIEPAP